MQKKVHSFKSNKQVMKNKITPPLSMEEVGAFL